MIYSMTAFGRNDAHTQWGSLAWEMRSINHRYLDLSLRLPEELRSIEPKVRQAISQRLHRGKVEAQLRWVRSADINAEVQVNDKVADALVLAADQLSARHPKLRPFSIADVLRWPGVVDSAATDYSALQQAALQLLDTSLDDFMGARAREGERISDFITQRLDQVSLHTRALGALRSSVVERQQHRLRERISALRIQADHERIEQELAIMANKLDTAEEIERLDAHVAEIHKALQRQEPIGRRLDFLMQELNREANTLASKSADVDTTGVSVELKVLIEQMREQIQNAE